MTEADRRRAMAEIERRSRVMAGTDLPGLRSPRAPTAEEPQVAVRIAIDLHDELDPSELADALLEVLDADGIGSPTISVVGTHLHVVLSLDRTGLSVDAAIVARDVAIKALERLGDKGEHVLNVERL